MDNNKISKLQGSVEHIAKLVDTLATAKVNEFISTAEAKGILSDMLKAAGLKQPQAPKVTETKEVSQ